MLKVIDLFAGAGGISLGAARAGFKVSAAVELDPFAFATHAKNFPETIHLRTDVATLSGKELLTLSGLREGELDGLVGGPPCQGFSAIGKRDVDDSRNSLFQHFFRLVAETKPLFFVAENVPGVLDAQYDDIRHTAFSLIKKDYVLLEPFEAKASLYGAATTRKRIFFVGYHAKRMKKEFDASDLSPKTAVDSIFVRSALKGLPRVIRPEWQTEKEGIRSIGKLGVGAFFDRVSGVIPKGVGDPNSLELYLEKGRITGCQGTMHSDEVIRRFARLKFGETDRISRSTRLNPNGFCPTLRAGTASDKGSFQAVRPIHYSAPRVITPREAARLQGFPDWFVFHSTKWHSFRQIGNSVSPLVSERILSSIRSYLI